MGGAARCSIQTPLERDTLTDSLAERSRRNTVCFRRRPRCTKKTLYEKRRFNFLVCESRLQAPFFLEHPGASRRLAATANRMSPATAKNFADRCIAGRFLADLATVVGCTGKNPRLPPNFGGLILEHRPPVVGCVPPP